MKELDYVELYAKELRENNAIFDQQKKLIEAPFKGSSSLFTRMFAGNFKNEARIYLKRRGLL